MSMASFINLCTHTINLLKRNRNVSGDFITVSTIPNLKGFVQYGDHLITNDKGETLKATAIVFLKDDCGLPPTTSQNVKLGRFSVGKASSSGSLLPEEMGFADSILVTSGIINRKVRSTRGIYRSEYGQFY